jgi:hypothetical protein
MFLIMVSQGTCPSEYILNLVNEALNNIDDQNIPLSTIIRKSIHIARLRNDFINLWWLEWEMISIDDKNLNSSIVKKIAQLEIILRSTTIIIFERA